jgi:hypothetical protein
VSATDIPKGGSGRAPTSGTQGAVPSPLSANFYLDPPDRLMAERGHPTVRDPCQNLIWRIWHAPGPPMRRS